MSLRLSDKRHRGERLLPKYKNGYNNNKQAIITSLSLSLSLRLDSFSARSSLKTNCPAGHPVSFRASADRHCEVRPVCFLAMGPHLSSFLLPSSPHTRHEKTQQMTTTIVIFTCTHNPFFILCLPVSYYIL